MDIGFFDRVSVKQISVDLNFGMGSLSVIEQSKIIHYFSYLGYEIFSHFENIKNHGDFKWDNLFIPKNHIIGFIKTLKTKVSNKIENKLETIETPKENLSFDNSDLLLLGIKTSENLQTCKNIKSFGTTFWDICLDILPKTSTCVVFIVGISKNDDFDDDIINNYSNCNIFIFFSKTSKMQNIRINTFNQYENKPNVLMLPLQTLKEMIRKLI